MLPHAELNMPSKEQVCQRLQAIMRAACDTRTHTQTHTRARSLAQATSVHELWDASAVNSQAAAAAPRASKAQLEAMTARVRNANKNPGE
jgi:hypothetical protein